MTTENAATASTETATAVAQQGATVASARASSKKGASPERGAPKSQKSGKGGKPAAEPTTPSDKSAKLRAKTTKPKAAKKARRSKPAARQGTHKAEVIALLQRKGGATLEQIMKSAGWQAHTVRGFISTLGKHGMKIESSKRESDGARVYAAR
ncbi:MAG: DUF3489 domain-containing protein [Bryobacteraceae bacterium]